MRSSLLVAMVGSVLSGRHAIAAAQGPVTPAPTLTSPSACPAVVRLAWDVSSIAGADNVRWRIFKGAPGAPRSAAELADNGTASGATGSLTRDLRDIGPVLDGTRYYFRVRAFRGSEALATISSPALFELDHTSDGMLQVQVIPASGATTNALKLDWFLSGPIGACANGIAWELKKDISFADAQVPDPSADKGTLRHISGSHTISVPSAGRYYLRIVGRQGGDTENDDIGRWSQASTSLISPNVALRVQVEDAAFSTCAGGSVAVPGATVRVMANGFDETRNADPAGRASFTVPGNASFQVTASAGTCLAQRSVQVTTAGDTDLKIPLPDCFHPQADLRLTTSDPWPGGVTGSPYSMTFTIRHGGLGGPSRPADLRVERVASGSSTAATELRPIWLGALCPSQTRAVTVVDPSPQLGTWTYRARLTAPATAALLTDFDGANNLVTRSAGFLAPAPVSADLPVALVVPPELEIAVTQSANPVVAGQPQVYTVRVRNTGGLPAGGVVVRNTLSEYVEFGSASVGVPFNTGCPRSGSTVTCTIPALAPGQSSTLTVRTLVPATAASGHDISFSARVDPDNAVAESNERNNLASAIASTQFSTAAIPPVVWQRATSEHHRLECPPGKVLSGAYGDSGRWLDNIGIVCAGTPREVAYLAVYGGVIPERFEDGCPMGSIPQFWLWTPPYDDTFISKPGFICPRSKVSYFYDPSKAIGVRGTVVFKPIGEITMRMEAACPDGAFPIGLDVYVDRAAVTGQKGIAGLGMICARLAS